MDRALEVDIMKKIPNDISEMYSTCFNRLYGADRSSPAGQKWRGGATVPFLDYLTCRSGCFGITGTEGKLLFVWGNGTKPLYPNRLLDID